MLSDHKTLAAWEGDEYAEATGLIHTHKKINKNVKHFQFDSCKYVMFFNCKPDFHLLEGKNTNAP